MWFKDLIMCAAVVLSQVSLEKEFCFGFHLNEMEHRGLIKNHSV